MKPLAYRLLALLLLSLAASAQEPWEKSLRELEARHQAKIDALKRHYEGRIAALEKQAVHAEDDHLENAVESLIDAHAGHGHGRVARFDNSANPSFSLSADFILAVSDRENSFDTLNQFGLRSLELGIAGRVDPHLAYYALFHFGDGVEVEEAWGWVDDWFPADLQLKFGRYSADFGRLSPLHEHELPFVDKPQVLQEFLGGSLRGTGLELHQRIALDEHDHLRWSFGVVNGLESDSHALFGPEASGHAHEHGGDAQPNGERELGHLAFHARVAAFFEVSEQSHFEVGVSGAWAPRERVEAEEENPLDGVEDDHEIFERERWVLGVDLSWRWSNPTTHQAFLAQAEVLMTSRQLLHDDDEELDGSASHELERETAMGFAAHLVYSFDDEWNLGASGGWFEHVEASSLSSWDAGLFLSWQVSESQRIRLEGRWFNDPEDDHWAIMLQWTTLLGSHDHAPHW